MYQRYLVHYYIKINVQERGLMIVYQVEMKVC